MPRKERVDPDQGFGVVKRRVCRDVPFLVLFAAYWVGMWIVAATAIKNGDPNRILSPYDYQKQFCGYNNTKNNASQLDLSSRPYVYYIDPLNLANPVCIASCPNQTAVISNISSAICLYNVTASVSTLPALIAARQCAGYTYASRPLLGRCVPTEPLPVAVSNTTSGTLSVDSIMSDGRDTAVQAITDLYLTWPVLAVAAAGALVLAILWVLLLQWFSGPFVWITLIAANVVMCASSVWLYFFWQKVKTSFNNSGSNNTVANATYVSYSGQYLSAENEVKVSMSAFIIMACLAGLLLLVTIAMFKRIRIAVQIIKEGSKSLARMPLIVLFPILIYGAIVLNFIYFIWIMFYLITPTDQWVVSGFGFTFSNSKTGQLMIWYHLVGFIWTYMFLIGVNQMTIAGAIGEWYWTLDKSKNLRLPVWRAFIRTLIYHLGSIALGSLLITIVEVIRILLYQLQRQVAKTQNKALQYVVACAQLCMKCVEILMKFINKNAYIYIAIRGTAFFKAAGEASALLIRNAFRTVAINFVSEFILFLSKAAVTFLVAWAAYLYIGYNTASYADVSMPILPAIFCGVEAFVISTAFFSIYHLAIDTIFLSFLEDCERNDGSAARPYFMSDNLKKILGKAMKPKGRQAGGEEISEL